MRGREGLAKRELPVTASPEGRPRAVIYARVSSKEQEREGFSVPAQLKLLRAYADTRRFHVVREVIDIETAKRAGRVGFGKMVTFLSKSPSCRVLLVEKTDRLYRNLKDWVVLDELDLEIHFVKEGVILAPDSRSSEKFIHGIKVLMAKNYIDNLSEETRKGMREKAEQGLWPSFAPLGYVNKIDSAGRKIIIPDPALGPIIIRMFERYATGRYSTRDVAKLARTEGLVFRKSKEPVSRATVHAILRHRIYTGDFDWDGGTYQGMHEPLISRELWNRVQDILERRFSRRVRGSRHDFAFSGLIACGHCGCALVGELKKGRYVYYHCTGAKGKCPERYTRQEVLEEHFARLLQGLDFDDEVMAWVVEALRQSHEDERRYQDEAIARLQGEHARLQNRLDAMYVDKLDGRVDASFFEQKAAEWRSEQRSIVREIEVHQGANENYLDEGVKLLELAKRAPLLFKTQESREKRRLLDFVVSNCTWKHGELSATYRQPFDLLATTARADRDLVGSGTPSGRRFENWLPGQDSNLRPSD